MYELAAELGLELLAILCYGLATVALSGLGLVAEYNGLQQLLVGDRLLAGWYAYIGLVALAFAATLAREKLGPRLADRRA